MCTAVSPDPDPNHRGEEVDSLTLTYGSSGCVELVGDKAAPPPPISYITVASPDPKYKNGSKLSLPSAKHFSNIFAIMDQMSYIVAMHDDFRNRSYTYKS